MSNKIQAIWNWASAHSCQDIQIWTPGAALAKPVTSEQKKRKHKAWRKFSDGAVAIPGGQ